MKIMMPPAFLQQATKPTTKRAKGKGRADAYIELEDDDDIEEVDFDSALPKTWPPPRSSVTSNSNLKGAPQSPVAGVDEDAPSRCYSALLALRKKVGMAFGHEYSVANDCCSLPATISVRLTLFPVRQ